MGQARLSKLSKREGEPGWEPVHENAELQRIPVAHQKACLCGIRLFHVRPRLNKSDPPHLK